MVEGFVAAGTGGEGPRPQDTERDCRAQGGKDST
jgi:hypothetical protein